MLAALAHPADHLFVGQHGAQRGTPVDGRFELIGEAMVVAVALDRVVAFRRDLFRDRQFGHRAATLLRFVEPGVEEHEKNRLRPAEVLEIGGCQLAIPIVREAEHFQLAAEVIDVLVGGGARMGARFLGVLFGRQPEGIPAHRVHDASSLHAVIAADDIGGRIPFGVPDV